MKKRFLALILALAMCLPLALAVSADEAGGVAATVLNFGYNMTNAEGYTDISITLYTGSEDIREVTSADIQTHKPYYILTDANGNTVKKENITSATFSLHLTDPGEYELAIYDSTGTRQGRPTLVDGNYFFDDSPIAITVREASEDDGDYIDHPDVLNVSYQVTPFADSKTVTVDLWFTRVDDPSLPIDSDFIKANNPYVIIMDRFGRFVDARTVTSGSMSFNLIGPRFYDIVTTDGDGYGQPVAGLDSDVITVNVGTDDYKITKTLAALADKWSKNLLERNAEYAETVDDLKYDLEISILSPFIYELDSEDITTFDLTLDEALTIAEKTVDYDETRLTLVYAIRDNWYAVDDAFGMYMMDKEGYGEEITEPDIPEITFDDVADGAWYADYVKMAADAGLIKGKGEGKFAPDENMTIAEAITLASRFNNLLHEIETDPADGKTGEKWYDPYIGYAKENSLPYDYADYNAKITREEFAHIFAALYKNNKSLYDEGGVTAINDVPENFIPDVPMTHKYSDDIYTLYRLGVLGGSDEKRSFLPDSNIKRSEVAAILCRMGGEGRVEF